MQPLHRDINPFALMLDPQAVFAQIERSERLDRLQRRICRPLDKPLIGTVGGDSDGDGDGDGDESVHGSHSDDTDVIDSCLALSNGDVGSEATFGSLPESSPLAILL